MRRLTTLPGGPFPRPQTIKRPIVASVFLSACPSRFPPAIFSKRSLENHSSIFLSWIPKLAQRIGMIVVRWQLGLGVAEVDEADRDIVFQIAVQPGEGRLGGRDNVHSSEFWRPGLESPTPPAA
jgi:hypothetical protein